MLVLVLTAPAVAQSPPVPPEFQDLHADLATTLETFAGSLPPATERAPVVFSTELSHADANRLEELLGPTSLVGALLAVDRLANAGVEAVTVNISYPMLYRPFHGDSGEYWSYLGFYRTIVREIAPDYLTLQAEPDVEESQTGQPVGSTRSTAISCGGPSSLRTPLTSPAKRDERNVALQGFAFISLFWSKYFFSYLDYGETFFLSPDQLLSLSQVASTQAMLAGRLTGTGETYRALIWLHSLLLNEQGGASGAPP